MSSRNLLKIFFLFSLFFFNNFAFASSQFSFEKNLSFGMRSPDVLKLQQILNQDIDTKVSDSGAGSPGNETEYFGLMTKKAVIKFQEKYSKEVLIPGGLSKGTGFVGALTKKKLNEMSSEKVVPIQSSLNKNTYTNKPINDSADTPSSNSNSNSNILRSGVFSSDEIYKNIISANYLAITNLSNLVVKPGDVLVIKGSGFEEKNTVHFGSSSAIDVSSTSTREIDVTVPSLSYGIYKIYVSNSKGSTEKSYPYSIKISQETKNRAVLESSMPLEASIGDTITVTGSNLEPTVDILSGVGIIKNVQVSDKTLKFNSADFSALKPLIGDPKVKGFPVFFKVKTKAGASMNSGYFTIK